MRLSNYVTLGDLGETVPTSSPASGIPDLQKLLNATSTASGAASSMAPPVNADIISQATAEASNLSKVVSPWLWVLSVISFSTAMFVNTPRINQMWNRFHMTKFKGLKKPS